MLETARRFAYAVAVLAAAVCFTVRPTMAQAQGAYLQVPASEPKYTAIVIDARSGEVLYAKRADSPRYPASITKIMTMYLAFEALGFVLSRDPELERRSSGRDIQRPRSRRLHESG